MAYLWYPLWSAAAALFVLVDARRRRAPAWRWAAATALTGPVALAVYLASRPLRAGECRRGGRSWQLASTFGVGWTALLALGVLWNLAWPSVPVAVLGAVWALGALPALLVALCRREATLVEEGPTGPLLEAALARFRPPPPTTADGRAYVCLACGNQYPVERLFCEVCGLWPGESG